MDNYQLRFVPLGGITEVTKNLYLYELYQNNTLEEILIVDCGVGFPKEKNFGVDLEIPDISYLEDKVSKIKAVLLTHGHEDHITGLCYHYHRLGCPPVFASRLTAIFTQAKFQEFGEKVNINEINYGQEYRVGRFIFRYLYITHSIPDTSHIFIKTPVGNFYHGSDFKFDLTPPYGPQIDFSAITKTSSEKVLCLLSDCLGAENEGYTISEKVVGKTFEDEMKNTKGKFFMTTFSSNVSRIRQCMEAAIANNRKICFLGRSMKENSLLASKINYLPLPVNFVVKEEELPKFPPKKLCLIVAGSQGQYDSALSKLANNENPYLKIEKNDKVVFSSDPIPGLENEVYELIERLSLLGADVVYSDIRDQLHASGHGNQQDLKLLIRLTRPKYLLPIGGTFRHQRQYLKLAQDLGYQENEVILLKEGDSVWFNRESYYFGERVPIKNVFVDAYGVGDVGNIILRDRQKLAKEGFVILNLLLDKNKKLKGIKFISRGFVFGDEQKFLFKKAERKVFEIYNKNSRNWQREDVVNKLTQALERLFSDLTGRQPMILVESIEI